MRLIGNEIDDYVYKMLMKNPLVCYDDYGTFKYFRKPYHGELVGKILRTNNLKEYELSFFKQKGFIINKNGGQGWKWNFDALYECDYDELVNIIKILKGE